MQQRTIPTHGGGWPGRPCRVLVEDPSVDLARIGDAAGAGFDVFVCTGPASPSEVCPLVVDGACPAGRPDVVVSAMTGPWRCSVEAAWREAGVPLVAVDEGVPLRWPAHVGAALQLALAPGEATEATESP